MISKIPVAATPLSLSDLLSVFGKKRSKSEFAEKLSGRFNRREIIFMSSGLAAFFVILSALKGLSDRKEVVLPAYTAPSLVVAVKKAGLKPVLTDISPATFNMDMELLRGVDPQKTLCVAAVHMFGIPLEIPGKLREDLKDVFIVEDCAQAFGSMLNGRHVGDMADISFFSFNRGKNLTTYSGGCVAMDRGEVAEAVKDAFLEKSGAAGEARMLALKLAALSVAVRPVFYGPAYALLSKFKETAPPLDLEVNSYSDRQASVGLSLLERIDNLSAARYRNGMALMRELAGVEGIVLPRIPENMTPAFNRFPVVFKDLEKKDAVQRKLNSQGIETSTFYEKPLHLVFDLGYGEQAFPNASYLASRLLTLPVHPMLKEPDIARMAAVVRSERGIKGRP